MLIFGIKCVPRPREEDPIDSAMILFATSTCEIYVDY